jgi:hypothetical protein
MRRCRWGGKACLRAHARPRGAVLILFCVFLATSLGLLACAVDIGWIELTRNQLQVAADASALAAAAELIAGPSTAEDQARSYTAQNPVGGYHQYANMRSFRIGTWDADQREFMPSDGVGNAVEVTLERRLPLFIGPLLGVPHVDMEATAIALANPRDIAFVIDLSASMNNDTEIWATQAINDAYPDWPGIGDELMDKIFEDFGFGQYPGVLQQIGPSSGNPNNSLSYDWLANTYLYNNWDYTTYYRTSSSDSSSTRKTKAYRWLVDHQLAEIMPEALPTTDSTANLSYWTKYLDYVIQPRSGLPPNQDSYRMDSGANPDSSQWPDLPKSSITQYMNKIGYLTYVQFMVDCGRTRRPVGSTHTPLSQFSPDCPWFVESNPDSPGYGHWFPPREQPTHAMRIALMAAMDKIALMNAPYGEESKDHVCIITFDTSAETQVLYPLNRHECDYEAIKDVLPTLQATAGGPASTASEHGLVRAMNHMDHELNPDGPRWSSRRVVVFVTDGMPNIKQSGNSTIDNYRNANPGEWFTTGARRYERNAVLMRVSQMTAKGWKVFPVGLGLGADRELLDRAARMAGTAITDPDNPDGPKISPTAGGHPANYEHRLTSIFNEIVGSPFVQLAR